MLNRLAPSGRIVFLDYARVAACFLVILVHAAENFYAADASGLAGNMTYLANEANRFWVSFYDGLARICVPLFMIISSYLLVPLKEGQTMGAFYRKRFLRVVPPMVFFMLLYTFLPLLWGGMTAEQSMQDFRGLPLNFPSMAGHLWFMYPLLGLYLFMPVISPWLERATRREEQVFLGLFLLSTSMPFLHRWLGTPVLSWLIRRFFGLRITDCNCGMRAFSRDAFERMRLVCGGMEFASEMLVKASFANLRVREFPISLHRDLRTDRVPHLHTWRDGWRHLRFLLLFAPHVVFRLPGTILVVLSGLGTAALCLGPVVVAGRTLDYHHLFYTVPLFCIGQQLLWFHAFAVRFRRFAGLGGDPPERLPLERWLVVGGLAAFVGVAVFASVLVDWWSSGRAALFAVRRCSLGLVLLLSGALSVMNALMTSMLELHFEAREER